MQITKVSVASLDRAAIASGYPMAVTMPSHTVPTENDWKRADRLAGMPSNSGHCNFLKGVLVTADFTGSMKWWVQAQRYTWFTIVSSQSTMHRGESFPLDDMLPGVPKPLIQMLKQMQIDCVEGRITHEQFIKCIPDGLEYGAMVVTNYMQLRNMFAQRKHHPLSDWKQFCAWIYTLPKHGWITQE